MTNAAEKKNIEDAAIELADVVPNGHLLLTMDPAGLMREAARRIRDLEHMLP